MQQLEINTDRLVLRTISIHDTEAILKYRSDDNANKYQGWIPNSIEDVFEFINKRVVPEINQPNTWHQLVIIQKDSNEIIGDIGIHFMDQEGLQVEVGFTLDKNHQGKGYATESIQKVIGYLFNILNKHRVVASVDPRNKKSIRLLERLGFRKEAHFKKSLLMNGVWVDDIIYAILKEEWLEK
ncbi:MAG: GNAT family N-acetyltransferase [Marinilabiliales bacterium]|nr:MAG: GNAT family N-acetyltransferase [Marinilabiliales bacterium]